MASTAVKLITLFGGGSYQSTILSTGPVALWPLSETSGTTAVDVVGGRNGTYNNVTLNSVPFSDGTGAPQFDSVNDFIALSGLSAVFNTDEGSIAVWAKVFNASVWTDSVQGAIIVIGADANNRIFIADQDINNTMYSSHRAGGTIRNVSTTTSTTAWFHIAITWSKSAGTLYQYFNGTSTTNGGAPGNWAGAISDTFSCIGRFSTAAAAQSFLGYIKYVSIWNRPLTPAEVAVLYRADFAV